MLRRLFVQASHYFAGSLLVMIAGLISFPIITRLLSVSDYGLMALISSILVLLQSFAKAGLQHSTLRYYAEIKSGITQWNLRQYFSTVLIGMAGISGVVSLLWCAIVLLSPSNWFSSSQLRTLLLITAPLICLDVLISGMTSIMKAQERSITINVFTVIGRYVQLAITLTFLFFISRTVIGFFGAQLLGYSLALIVVLRLVYKGQGAGIRGYDWELQKGMLQFGIPLIVVSWS
jgi:O-antigen/teichoic acid export membrane protein